jgi:hypothetical protein
MIDQMVTGAVGDLLAPGQLGSYNRVKALTSFGLEVIMGAAGATIFKELRKLIPDVLILPSGKAASVFGPVKKFLTRLEKIRDKVANPIFSAKVKALNDILQSKFVNDFYEKIDDFNVLFSDFPDVVDVWKKLGGRPEWVRLNKELLEKLAGKSDDFLENVNKLYENMGFPATVKPPFPTFKPITFGGKIINLEFNKFGFPQFWKHRTKIYLNGLEFDTKYTGDWKKVSPTVLHGAARNSDLGKASTWAINNYPPNTVRRSTTSGNKISTTRIDILRDGGDFEVESDWISQTWHHHENGKDLIPIPSEIHNPINHSGGHATRFGPDGTHLNQTADTDVSGLFEYELE